MLSGFSRSIMGYGAFTSDNAFKQKTADTLFSLCDYFQSKYESKGDEFFAEANDDSLTLSMKGNQFLLSRQLPGHQIWVSSPVSGSLKFDYDNERNDWFDHKIKDRSLKVCLTEELQTAFGC
ncbi:frataxin, putative [Trichomonas vaginalis G3]|uniref:Frataxin, putative n=1 Tax=Trichomonas vaginalis (strain ATCC PRA-98 / G3) TaxID=412133 RepID=A2D8V3_TRIV3|nr:Frataxin-like domain family [Trichomonas vaginalis G3]EAY22979.1 frataxin, putative [Trichomonas vaginalis G3]KAI5518942.1 Frataxin-like domain family [Trichomonas vaginalis G3]|eukprot:XP_001583965.1 frataxin [Trichomonas vaginalis G3]